MKYDYIVVAAAPPVALSPLGYRRTPIARYCFWRRGRITPTSITCQTI